MEISATVHVAERSTVYFAELVAVRDSRTADQHGGGRALVSLFTELLRRWRGGQNGRTNAIKEVSVRLLLGRACLDSAIRSEQIAGRRLWLGPPFAVQDMLLARKCARVGQNMLVHDLAILI